MINLKFRYQVQNKCFSLQLFSKIFFQILIILFVNFSKIEKLEHKKRFATGICGLEGGGYLPRGRSKLNAVSGSCLRGTGTVEAASQGSIRVPSRRSSTESHFADCINSATDPRSAGHIIEQDVSWDIQYPCKPNIRKTIVDERDVRDPRMRSLQSRTTFSCFTAGFRSPPSRDTNSRRL